MGRWKLFVLLLMLTLYVDSEETLIDLQKTMGREPHVTPICSNSTLNIITLIICKVRTEMSPGEQCLLTYRLGRGFEHKCEPRVRLKEDNQTIFLDLTSLTPMDSGDYSCECTTPTGTKILHLNITVKEDGATRSVPKMSFGNLPLISVIILIIISGVILGFISRKIHHGNRRQQELPPSPAATDRGEPDNPYESLQQPSSDLYHTISSEQHPPGANTAAAHQDIDDTEMEQRWEVYENL